MKGKSISRNASDDIGLMDTFLSRPNPKRWLFSKISYYAWDVAESIRKLSLFFEPRKIHINERILELPFVLQRLPYGAKVLDVGSSSSALALQLACLGYEVTGIDVRPYSFQHKNLRFYQEDIANCSILRNSHDFAILISTLEHMGLGSYGDSTLLSDKEFLDLVAALVKPRGQILVTFPFGARFEGSWYRVYDNDSLHTLLTGYEIIEKLFAKRTGDFSFEMCNAKDLQNTASETLPVNGVALLNIRKPAATT